MSSNGNSVGTVLTGFPKRPVGIVPQELSSFRSTLEESSRESCWHSPAWIAQFFHWHSPSGIFQICIVRLWESCWHSTKA
ncbi:hypothetical protein DPMN_112980 [Dreissena polymorpha]|uniref:Uncharacterized protein n=1 Tax=Dreissena polymorpha TaxID=45954 RepID=A0A9D4QQI6_DREPO|nr:hypothetical protein DPMN_112980 [Dreissena polymorpha]